MNLENNYNESGDFEKRRKGLTPLAASLIAIIACIFVVCVLAVVLGLIPVYIQAANGSSSSTPVVATPGMTDIRSSARVFAVDYQPTGRSLARNLINCGNDILGLSGNLKEKVNHQGIRSCHPVTTVSIECDSIGGLIRAIYSTAVILKSDTIFCSIDDMTMGYVGASGEFEPDMKRRYPRGIFKKFDKLTSNMKYTGHSGHYNNGKYETFEFGDCEYINDLPLVHGCTNSTSEIYGGDEATTTPDPISNDPLTSEGPITLSI